MVNSDMNLTADDKAGDVANEVNQVAEMAMKDNRAATAHNKDAEC